MSALITVKLYTGLGEQTPFLITGVVLAVYVVASWLVLRVLGLPVVVPDDGLRPRPRRRPALAEL